MKLFLREPLELRNGTNNDRDGALDDALLEMLIDDPDQEEGEFGAALAGSDRTCASASSASPKTAARGYLGGRICLRGMSGTILDSEDPLIMPIDADLRTRISAAGWGTIC